MWFMTWRFEVFNNILRIEVRKPWKISYFELFVIIGKSFSVQLKEKDIQIMRWVINWHLLLYQENKCMWNLIDLSLILVWSTLKHHNSIYSLKNFVNANLYIFYFYYSQSSYKIVIKSLFKSKKRLPLKQIS